MRNQWQGHLKLCHNSSHRESTIQPQLVWRVTLQTEKRRQEQQHPQSQRKESGPFCNHQKIHNVANLKRAQVQWQGIVSGWPVKRQNLLHSQPACQLHKLLVTPPQRNLANGWRARSRALTCTWRSGGVWLLVPSSGSLSVGKKAGENDSHMERSTDDCDRERERLIHHSAAW